MNSKQTIIAGFLATSALFFGTAFAQGTGMAGMNCDGPGAMQGRGGMRAGMQRMEPGAMAERHIERLKSELKITGQQESLWAAYAEKARSAMGKRPDTTGDEKLSAPERMAKMQAHMKERMAAMDGAHESFKRLYDSLSADQKAAADKHFSRMGPGGRGAMGSNKAGAAQGPSAASHNHG